MMAAPSGLFDLIDSWSVLLLGLNEHRAGLGDSLLGSCQQPILLQIIASRHRIEP